MDGLGLHEAFGGRPEDVGDPMGLESRPPNSKPKLILYSLELWKSQGSICLKDLQWDVKDTNGNMNSIPGDTAVGISPAMGKYTNNILAGMQSAYNQLYKDLPPNIRGFGFFIAASDQCCKNIDFIQIYWDYRDGKLFKNAVDGGSYYSSAKKYSGLTVMIDLPTTDNPYSNKPDSPAYWTKELKLTFETCAVCRDPGMKYIISCVTYEIITTPGGQSFNKRAITSTEPSPEWKTAIQGLNQGVYDEYFK